MQPTRAWKKPAWLVAVVLACLALALGSSSFAGVLQGAFSLMQWYAREHVLLCLVPAFFIAGALSVFIRQATVLRYLGPGAGQPVAYGVAAVSGSIVAVCSCTVLPLFTGIYRRGAGLGPAITFLYSGPAINLLAIVLTARVIGPEMGIARGAGAIASSILIGAAMAALFAKDLPAIPLLSQAETGPERPAWQTALFFVALLGILVFVNWGAPQDRGGLWAAIYVGKWQITALFAVGLAGILLLWWPGKAWQVGLTGGLVILAAVVWPDRPALAFTTGLMGLAAITAPDKGDAGKWFASSWGLARQIFPLLLLGIALAGILLGGPGNEGLLPTAWIQAAVGDNSLRANLLASLAGACMYVATLTEIPLLQGLLANGMAKGPALALLLAGPTLSLPNMLVLHRVLGIKKTMVFISLVILTATGSGLLFGACG